MRARSSFDIIIIMVLRIESNKYTNWIENRMNESAAPNFFYHCIYCDLNVGRSQLDRTSRLLNKQNRSGNNCLQSWCIRCICNHTNNETLVELEIWDHGSVGFGIERHWNDIQAVVENSVITSSIFPLWYSWCENELNWLARVEGWIGVSVVGELRKTLARVWVDGIGFWTAAWDYEWIGAFEDFIGVREWCIGGTGEWVDVPNVHSAQVLWRLSVSAMATRAPFVSLRAACMVRPVRKAIDETSRAVRIRTNRSAEGGP